MVGQMFTGETRSRSWTWPGRHGPLLVCRCTGGKAAAAAKKPVVVAGSGAAAAAGAAANGEQVSVGHLVLVAGNVGILWCVVFGEQARVEGAQRLPGDLGEDRAGPLLRYERGRGQGFVEGLPGVLLQQLLLLLQKLRLLVGRVEGALRFGRARSRSWGRLVLLLEDADDDDDEEEEDGDGETDDQDQDRKRLLDGVVPAGGGNLFVRENAGFWKK